MLTRIIIRNFKRFHEVEVELANPVVFIGPNNSGKTSALQALAFWQVGLMRWNEKRRGRTAPEKRPGVTINRRDLVAIPVPDANLLWRNLHVRDVRRLGGGQETKNVRIDIVVEGVTEDRAWKCGLEFDYANEESFYCRPLRLEEDKNPDRMAIPPVAGDVQVAFLPPMSGLVANETRLDPGAITVRVGEGRTAEVLRNLCYKIFVENSGHWDDLKKKISSLFGAVLDNPRYIAERGEIVMSYRENGNSLDLSSSGRGLQQTLLVLTYMYANPGAVLLLDEPDAHLEILRQRQIYQLLTEIAKQNGNQIIAASHSEVLLNEAGDRDTVVAFVGKPHRINDRGSQVLKALRDIGWEDFYQAELTGWALYLEGSTDLAILRRFAQRTKNLDAEQALERPFVHYVGNQPMVVNRHFYGLREALPKLLGFAIFDQLDRDLPADMGAEGITWGKKEIENYLCHRETLISYAEADIPVETMGPLFDSAEKTKRVGAMEQAISEVEQALEVLGRGSPWDGTMKVSDEFLPQVFERYFSKLGLPNLFSKTNYHELVEFVPQAKIERDIRDIMDALDRIASIHRRAYRSQEDT